MVLPPNVHKGELREHEAHVSAVDRRDRAAVHALQQPAGLWRRLHAGVVAGLCGQHENLHAVKESSGDARRVSGVKALLGDRVDALVGLDDMLVEAVAAVRPAGSPGS